MGNYVYATFTEGQARRIAEHYEKRDGKSQDVWRIEVPKDAVQQVGQHPPWAGLSDFKEVGLNHVPPSQLTRVCPGNSGYDGYDRPVSTLTQLGLPFALKNKGYYTNTPLNR